MTYRILGAAPIILALLASPAAGQGSAGIATGSPGSAAVTSPGAPAPAGLPSPTPFPGGLPSPQTFPGGLPSPQPFPAGVPSSVIAPPGTPQPGSGMVPVLPADERAPSTGAIGGVGRPAVPPAVPPGPWSAAAIEHSFMTADANGDGDLTRAEARALSIAPLPFEEMDLNRDGVITRFEYSTAVTGR